jgi:hypothetical protein
MRLTLSGVISSVAIVCASPVAAQTVTGRVLMPDSVTPAPGIVVTVVNANGNAVGRALTSRNGAYSVRLPRPGQHDVRALRIGFRPTVVHLDIAGAATVTRDLVLTSLPVVIEGVEIGADDDCSLNKKDGQVFLSLWEQARGALAATSLWEQSGSLDIDVMRVEGHTDPKDFSWERPDSESLFVRLDTAGVRELAVSRLFASTPPETLIKSGYVRAGRDGRPIFDMPNAEVLLSDAFVDSHCFTLKRRRDHTGWIGFAFEPRRRVENFVDVEGVLWLDRASAELRQMEYKYTNLPEAAYEICDKAPLIKVLPDMLKEQPPFKQPAPQCYTHREDGRNRLGVGGSADFVRLPTGEWMVSSWTLLTPPDEAKYRRGYRSRYLPRERKTERCWDADPNCRTIVAMIPRLVLVKGITTRVVRDGIDLYTDSSNRPLLDAMIRQRAGDDVAHLVGIVVDDDRRPITNAIVQVEDPWRSARTSMDGVFRVSSLPAGSLVISVRCSGYLPRRVRLPLVKDSTHRIRIDLQPDTVGIRGAGCAQRQ